eukprot:s1414_g10.t1
MRSSMVICTVEVKRALAADGREARRKEPTCGRLVVQRWRPGYVDLKAPMPKESEATSTWQGGPGAQDGYTMAEDRKI